MKRFSYDNFRQMRITYIFARGNVGSSLDTPGILLVDPTNPEDSTTIIPEAASTPSRQLNYPLQTSSNLLQFTDSGNPTIGTGTTQTHIEPSTENIKLLKINQSE